MGQRTHVREIYILNNNKKKLFLLFCYSEKLLDNIKRKKKLSCAPLDRLNCKQGLVKQFDFLNLDLNPLLKTLTRMNN